MVIGYGLSSRGTCGSLPEIKFSMTDEENTLKALKILEAHPELTQRELAAELGVSLGKTHYLIKSFVDIGLVKLDNFQRSNNKWGYAYLLTPQGIAEKAAITVRFLARKQEEYKRLEREIEELKSEVEGRAQSGRR